MSESNDYGFYLDSKGRSVVECQCGSFVVFQTDSVATNRMCFRCGSTVERPILERNTMADIDSERDDSPDDLEEVNKNEAADYTDEDDEVVDEDDDDNLDEDIEDEDEGLPDDLDTEANKEF